MGVEKTVVFFARVTVRWASSFELFRSRLAITAFELEQAQVNNKEARKRVATLINVNFQ